MRLEVYEMTSPPRQVDVECPKCGTQFVDWIRDSINLSLGEEWSEAILEATTVKCPTCGWQGDSEAIIVSW